MKTVLKGKISSLITSLESKKMEQVREAIFFALSL